jgi:hypothetical protein
MVNSSLPLRDYSLFSDVMVLHIELSILHAPGTCSNPSNRAPLGCLCSLLRYDHKHHKRYRNKAVDSQPRNVQWHTKRFNSMVLLTKYVQPGDYDVKLNPHITAAWGPPPESRFYTYRDNSRVFIGAMKDAFNEDTMFGAGPIKFITDQPGRQLLSGSFHPVNDDNWDHGVLTRPLLTVYRRHTTTNNKDDNSTSDINSNDVKAPSSYSIETLFQVRFIFPAKLLSMI